MSGRPTYEELEEKVKQLGDEAAERERLEKALELQRQELISIFDSIDEGIYICDPESFELLYVNEAVKALFGPDIVGKKCYQVLQGLDKPCGFCTNPKIFGENLGKPHIWEFQNKKNWRWYRCIDKAIRWPGGKMVRYEMAIDIHDVKVVEGALLESEERYRRITESMTDYICTVKIQDGVAVETIHGPACVRVTGYTTSDFWVDPYLWINMVHEEDRKAVEQQAADILSGVNVRPLEHRITRKDGVVRWVRNSPVPYYDSQGRLLYYDGLIQDITERKLAEDALRKANEELYSLTQQLEEKVLERTAELEEKNKELIAAERFAAIGQMANRVAHELRNSLTVIGGFALRANKATPDNDPRKKHLGLIVDEVSVLERKVSNIINIQDKEYSGPQ